jgi:hypothetical protein
LAEEREFIDQDGNRWGVAYSEGGDRGMISMSRLVFKALDEEGPAEERFLSVHHGFLEGADDHKLEVALSQAYRVDPPV